MPKRKIPDVVVREGKPVAVILDIDDYRDILERLEDLDDLKDLEKIRSGRPSFRHLSEFLAEFSPEV